MASGYADAVSGTPFQEQLRFEIDYAWGGGTYARIAPLLASCKDCVAQAQTSGADVGLRRFGLLQSAVQKAHLPDSSRLVASAFLGAAHAYCHYAGGNLKIAKSMTIQARSYGAALEVQVPVMRLHILQMDHNLIRIARRGGAGPRLLHEDLARLLTDVMDQAQKHSARWRALAETFWIQVSREYLRPPLDAWQPLIDGLRALRDRVSAEAAAFPVWESTFGYWWDFRSAMALRCTPSVLTAMNRLLAASSLLDAGFAADAIRRYSDAVSGGSART